MKQSNNMDYSYNEFQKKILYKFSSYIEKHQEKAPKINYGGWHFSGDPREENLLEQLLRKLKYENKFKSRQPNESIERVISSSFSTIGEKYHMGYMEYLLCAWINYYGIQIGPWHLWNLFVWNLKEMNRRDPELYRPLWVTGKNNNVISIADKFDIKQFITELGKYAPGETINCLALQFSNQPDYYIDSIYGLIAEIGNGYYSTYIYSCNIPSVKILGTEAEWGQLKQQIQSVKQLYKPVTNVILERYFDKVEAYFDECIENYNNEQYWLELYRIENCGSGHQKVIGGHITKMFVMEEILVDNSPNLTGSFEFLFDNKRRRYISGVLSSYLDGDTLVPLFGYMETELDLELNDSQKSELIEAIEMLNSYYASPIYHKRIDESAFEQTLRDYDLITGKKTADEYINEHSNDNLDVEKTKENILKIQKNNIGKDIIQVQQGLITEKRDKLKMRSNFWFENNEISTSPVLFLTTERWLNGRTRQTNIELICDKLDEIYEIVEPNQYREIFKCIMASYNETLYLKYIQSDDELYQVIEFLLTNITNENEDRRIDKYSKFSLHTAVICQILIVKIMEQHEDKCQLIYDWLIDEMIDRQFEPQYTFIEVIKLIKTEIKRPLSLIALYDKSVRLGQYNCFNIINNSLQSAGYSFQVGPIEHNNEGFYGNVPNTPVINVIEKFGQRFWSMYSVTDYEAEIAQAQPNFLNMSKDAFMKLFEFLVCNEPKRSIWDKHLFYTFNPLIYSQFLDCYKVKPYPININGTCEMETYKSILPLIIEENEQCYIIVINIRTFNELLLELLLKLHINGGINGKLLEDDICDSIFGELCTMYRGDIKILVDYIQDKMLDYQNTFAVDEIPKNVKDFTNKLKQYIEYKNQYDP